MIHRKTFILMTLSLLCLILPGCAIFSSEPLLVVDPGETKTAWVENRIDGGYNYDGERFSIWVEEIRAHELPSGFGSWLFPDFPALIRSFQNSSANDAIQITAYIYHFDPASTNEAKTYQAKISSDNRLYEPLESEAFHTSYSHGYSINNRKTYGYSRYVFQFQQTEENLKYFTLHFCDENGEPVAQPLNYQFRFIRYVKDSYYSWDRNPKSP